MQMNVPSEGKEGKSETSPDANVQFLQSVGGNGGKSPITSGHQIDQLRREGKTPPPRTQLGGKWDGKSPVTPMAWRQRSQTTYIIECFIKRVYRGRVGNFWLV